MSGSGDNRSVTARDITGSSVVTGDNNTVTTTMRQVAAPPADKVDVRAELAALKELLAQLKNVPDRGRLDRAMEDAVEETAKPAPDKAEVGNALERVAKCAKAATLPRTPRRLCRGWWHWVRGWAPPAARCSIPSASRSEQRISRSFLQRA
jgi:hypothetical protein